MNPRTSKKKKSRFKSTIKRLHLYFGLTIGALILIISLTGALYVFKEDFEKVQRQEITYHGEENYTSKNPLPIVNLEKQIELQVGEPYPLHWVEIPINKSKSYKFFYFERNPEAWNYFDEYPIYKSVYINPYSGKVLSVQDEKMNFFALVKSIHWSYMLNSDWGKYVVGIPVICFLFMLISGIILWWPKNKAARKQRFWFQWKNMKNWRRKNYDLHSILGFYASFIALVVTITGLFYSFYFIQAALYFAFSGGSTAYPDYSHLKSLDKPLDTTEHVFDRVASQIDQMYPEASAYSFDLGHAHPFDHEDPENNLAVYVRGYAQKYYNYSEVFFDQNSGRLLLNRPYETRNFGEKYIAANYDIHVGAILGVFGKILALISSLICASLPITGYLVWRGRTKKKKRTSDFPV
ncbi:PepSY-associated TM helix domain-containing protein [Chryseobacterium sp. A321]